MVALTLGDGLYSGGTALQVDRSPVHRTVDRYTGRQSFLANVVRRRDGMAWGMRGGQETPEVDRGTTFLASVLAWGAQVIVELGGSEHKYPIPFAQ